MPTAQDSVELSETVTLEHAASAEGAGEASLTPLRELHNKAIAICALIESDYADVANAGPFRLARDMISASAKPTF